MDVFEPDVVAHALPEDDVLDRYLTPSLQFAERLPLDWRTLTQQSTERLPQHGEHGTPPAYCVREAPRTSHYARAAEPKLVRPPCTRRQ